MPVVLPVTMMAFSERRMLFGTQDSFHDFPPVHPVEGLVPVGQFPDAADDWPDVEPSGGQQRQHALPDRPVVRETPLEGDVLLDQRIEGKAQGLRSPADLADPTVGTDQVEGSLEGGGGARRVDDAIGPKSVALPGPRGGVADERLAAIGVGDVQPGPVTFQADQCHLGAAEPGHGGAQNPDGTRPQHHDAIARMHASVEHDGVVGYAARFGEGRFLHGQSVGHAMQTPGRHADVAGHGAIHPVAEALPAGIKIVQPLPGERAVGIDNRRGLGNHALAFLPLADGGAGSGDDSAKFMAEHDGIVDLPAVRGRPLMEVAAADSDGLDGEEDILGAGFGPGEFTQFDTVSLRGEVDDGR